MTFEESTSAIRQAAETQDLAALEAAARQRDAAISSLRSLPPSPELCASVSESLTAGEEAKKAILLLKQRMRSENRILTDIEQGFLRTMRGEGKRRIDCKG